MKLTTAQNLSFEQDAKLVKHLLEELLQEQAALVKVDITAVEAIIDKKFSLLQELSSVAKNRYEVLTTLGYEGSENGMVEWIKAQRNASLQKAWSEFQSLLVRTKETNRLNGILINKHFSRNQQTLNLLQGKPEAANLYGKNGQAKTSAFNRSVLMA